MTIDYIPCENHSCYYCPPRDLLLKIGKRLSDLCIPAVINIKDIVDNSNEGKVWKNVTICLLDKNNAPSEAVIDEINNILSAKNPNSYYSDDSIGIMIMNIKFAD